MRREVLDHDGIRWLDIAAAAQRCGMAVSLLDDLIAGEKLRCWEDDGTRWVPQSAVVRLTRENNVLKSARRQGKKLLNATPTPPKGPHAAREVQDVLPMSSGRAGSGWLGVKPRS